MNVIVTTLDAPLEVWTNPAWLDAIGARNGVFRVPLVRQRSGSRVMIRQLEIPATFPITVQFSVGQEWQHGDVLVIPWNPGLGTIDGQSLASVIDNASGDPVTRPAYVIHPARPR